MNIVEFDLSSLYGIKTDSIFLKNDKDSIENFKLIHKHWGKNDKIYNILKYDKNILTYDMVDKTGLFRSVIYSNKKINVFSPPKSLNINVFASLYDIENCVVEEFIEGTMINLFYDTDIDRWEIASKTTVGCDVTFLKDQPTFREMFYEICDELNIDFNMFSKEYCYSFVMQHPKNKFVIQLIEKRLYLIAVYKIDNETYKVTQIPRYYNNDILQKIYLPLQYKFNSYNEVIDVFGSMNTNSNIMGAIIYNINGSRTKVRNPNYEYIKHLRGNNTKLQYQYLSLRKLGQVKDYLKFFPDDKKSFLVFKTQVHNFTDNLYKNYIKCYIKKEKPLTEFPYQFRNHMFNLHQHYLLIKAEKGYINKITVINYVNNLESPRLMYSLNYHLRDITPVVETQPTQMEI